MLKDKYNAFVAPRVDMKTEIVKFWRTGVCFAAIGLLSSCAAVSGAKAPSDTYQLATADVTGAQSVRKGAQILIAEPGALKVLDSQNIVIETAPLTVQYLSDAQWADRLPRVVQQKLASSFENSGQFSGVGLPGQGLAIDYQLITEIQAFSIRSSGNQAEVTISVKLLNDKNGNIVGSKMFTATMPAGSGASKAYVRALNSAFSKVSNEIVVWVTTKI